MMGLVAYSDSEDEEGQSPPSQTKDPEESAYTASRHPTAHSEPKAAPPVPSFVLPDAGALLDGLDSGAAVVAASTTKRSSTQVTGSSRPAPRPAKTAKGGVAGGASGKAARGGSAASGSTSRMLPPQLQGRKNVPTEDYARLFTKKSLSAANATNSTDTTAPAPGQ